ncbi:hypothetical protein AB0C29_00005 [Actinoplanes sp. NPDC048791]|uniref:hypothetical protein n=1 Tax=Actinoplanes sp. NPDC048791 TaxID=3154623 RepID=UPI0033CE83D9
MTSTDDHRGENPVEVQLPDLLEQIHSQAAQTAGHDVDAGAARLTAWMNSQRERETAAVARPARRLPKSRTGHGRPSHSARRQVRVPAKAGIDIPAATASVRSRPRAMTERWHPTPRDSVELQVFGVHLQGRFGPMVVRVLRTLAQAAVAVVGLLHDTQWAIAAIAGLAGAYLLVIALVAMAAVHSAEDRRRDARQVLRMLLGQEEDNRRTEAGDTFITVNGGKTRIG